MKIPKRFKLLNQTINVVYTDTPFIESPDATGFASYRLNEIQIRKYPERTEEQEQQTFWHEVMHFVFYYSGPSLNRKNEPFRDESFVELTAALLHQVIETMEYEEE